MGLESALVTGYASRDAARMQSNAADRAAALQAQVARESTDEQRRQYNQSRSDILPWIDSGRSALGRLDRSAAGDMSDFQRSPDYNFRRSEGQRDICSSFAARGGAASGNALRALSEFNQNLASGEFGNWWNRTAAQAGVGQSAVSQSSALGANAAGNIAGINGAAAGRIGDYGIAGANARASGVMATANAVNQSNANTANIAGYFFGLGK